MSFPGTYAGIGDPRLTRAAMDEARGIIAVVALDMFFGAVGGGTEATVAVTLPAPGVVAVASAPVTGAVSRTIGASALASSAAGPVTVSVAVALTAPDVASVASAPSPGLVSRTIGASALAGSASALVTGAAAAVVASHTAAIVAPIVVTGSTSASTTIGADAVGSPQLDASMSSTLAAVVLHSCDSALIVRRCRMSVPLSMARRRRRRLGVI